MAKAKTEKRAKAPKKAKTGKTIQIDAIELEPGPFTYVVPKGHVSPKRKPTFYEVLRVTPGAPEDEIVAAFPAAMSAGGDHRAVLAWLVLTHPVARPAYDAMLASIPSTPSAVAPPPVPADPIAMLEWFAKAVYDTTLRRKGK